jgi:hypothetical protein
LRDLMLIGNCSIIINSFHVFCYYVILTWHLARLSHFYNVVTQIFIRCASWNISKIIITSFILCNWLSLSIILLFSPWMICSSIRIICGCNNYLLICIVSIKTIFQIIYSISKILLLCSIIYNVQANLTLMSFILTS